MGPFAPSRHWCLPPHWPATYHSNRITGAGIHVSHNLIYSLRVWIWWLKRVGSAPAMAAVLQGAAAARMTRGKLWPGARRTRWLRRASLSMQRVPRLVCEARTTYASARGRGGRATAASEARSRCDRGRRMHGSPARRALLDGECSEGEGQRHGVWWCGVGAALGYRPAMVVFRVSRGQSHGHARRGWRSGRKPLPAFLLVEMTTTLYGVVFPVRGVIWEPQHCCMGFSG